MAEYQLTANPDVVSKQTDEGQMFIPNDPANRDYVEYQNWLELGNEPDSRPPGHRRASTDDRTGNRVRS